MPQAFAIVPMSCSSAIATCFGFANKLANRWPCDNSSPSFLHISNSMPSACAQVIAADLPQKTPERYAVSTALNFLSAISRKRISRTSVIAAPSIVRYCQIVFLFLKCNTNRGYTVCITIYYPRYPSRADNSRVQASKSFLTSSSFTLPIRP